MRGRLIAAALIAIGVVFLITRGPDDLKGPSTTSTTSTLQPVVDPNAIPDAVGTPVASGVPIEVERAARAFFSSYVRVLYGQGRTIRNATPAITSELQRAGANPALRGHNVTVGKIRGTRTGAAYRVVAQITDTVQPEPYPLEAGFGRTRSGAWLADDFTVGE